MCEIPEILRKFELIAVQASRSSKVIDLGVNRKLVYATSY